MKLAQLSRSIPGLASLASLVVPWCALADVDVVSPVGSGDSTNCRVVQAAQDPRVVVDCPADQIFDFCFTRKTEDQANIITGTMEYFSDPSKARMLEHAPHQERYNGVIKMVTASGVLEIEENGIWDSESKDWAGLSTVTGGTGDFEGATGKLVSFGNTDATGTGLMIGTICTE